MIDPPRVAERPGLGSAIVSIGSDRDVRLGRLLAKIAGETPDGGGSLKSADALVSTRSSVTLRVMGQFQIYAGSAIGILGLLIMAAPIFARKEFSPLAYRFTRLIGVLVVCAGMIVFTLG